MTGPLPGRQRREPVFRDGEDGRERRCSRCSEWWPADAEFFCTDTRGALQSWCRACMSDYKSARRQAAAAAQPSAQQA